MPWALLVKPSGLPPQDPYTQLFFLLIVGLLRINRLAMLAKPYPVFGPTYMPQIPNLLHCMSKGAHEVLGTVLVARLMLVFTIKSFVLSICHCIFVFKHALSFCSPFVIHWISKLFIDSIIILFTLYLLLWSCFPTTKPARLHQKPLGHQLRMFFLVLKRFRWVLQH